MLMSCKRCADRLTSEKWLKSENWLDHEMFSGCLHKGYHEGYM